MILELYRTYKPNFTMGVLKTSFGDFKTLERPRRGNIPNISCIDEGTYTVRKSAFFGGKHKGSRAFRFDNVRNRSGILIHTGNTVNDCFGCVLVGKSSNSDGSKLYFSRNAFDEMWEKLPEVFTIFIKAGTVGITAFTPVMFPLDSSLEGVVDRNVKSKKWHTKTIIASLLFLMIMAGK